MLDCIFIKGLALEATIGIYPHEQTKKQPLMIDVDLFLDISMAAKTNQLQDTVDYDLVVARIRQVVAARRFDLIETLIIHLAELILAEFNVEKVACTVCKLKAVKHASVGISIVREKSPIINRC